MIAKIHNQNFGWSVACDGNWAAVGNPSVLRYDPLTGSIIRTGSVEVYKYNINSDIHDLKKIIYRQTTPPEILLLSTEFTNSVYYYIHTEYTGSVPITADKDLLVDVGQYRTASDDGYGFAVDIKDTILAVGNPYFESIFTLITQSFSYTGSGCVDIYDLSKLDIDPYATRIPPTIANYSFISGISGSALVGVSVPAWQDYRYVYFQTRNTTIPGDDWQNIIGEIVPAAGGLFFLQTNYTPTDLIPLEARVIGVVGTDPYLTTIYNPNTSVTESFGWAVSLNNEWLAVGSPLESGSRGSVFMFRKMGEDNASWSFVQNIPLPSDIQPGDGFGSSIEVNKATGSFSGSMVVGSTKLSHSRAYIYEFDGTNWNNNFTLNPDNVTVYNLPFYPVKPIIYNYPNYADWFGYDVSMYEDSVMVGAPYDRVIQEYESSSYYQEGAVYFFQRCPNRDYGYYMVRKSYGNEKIMKDNLLGWSVSIRNPYAVAGIPKINPLSSSICYLRGSLFQIHFCESSQESSLQGQFILYNENTSSVTDTSLTNIDWDITNIYQIKKRYLSPYRNYGWDIDICEQFIIVGSPMLISGSNTVMAFYREAPFGPIVLSVSSGSAVLDWTYTYAEQDGFNIEKSTDGVTYGNIYILSNSVSRSYTDTTVSWNNTYWYRVNAFNDLGVSEYSNTSSIFFPPPPPVGPIVLSVQSGSITGPSVLSWSFTDDFQDGFNIEKSTNGIAFSNINILAVPAARTDNDAAVSIDNTYWYRVNAYNVYGTSSYSNTASIYYLIPVPSGPTVLTVTTGSVYLQSIGTGSSILSWSYTNTTETGWNIEKSSSAALGFINASTLVVPSLRAYEDSASIDANSTYWYRVQPYNGYGTGSYSNIRSASFSNILYFSGSSKFYINPIGTIVETGSLWKSVSGYKNINLTNLNVSSNSLDTLTLISASALTWLSCSNNNLTSLDLNTNPAVNRLYCQNNSLTYINTGNCNLYQFYCYNNQLPSLDVTQCIQLHDFYCQLNQLTSLDVTQCTTLEGFLCNNNLLTSLDLSQNTVIDGINFSYNQLSYIDVSTIGFLRQIDGSHNLLTGSNFSGLHPRLYSITLINNLLPSINLESCNTIGTLLLERNLLTDFEHIGPSSQSLVAIGFGSNPFTSSFVDMTLYPSASYLYGYGANISSSAKLLASSSYQYLSIYGNAFPTLDLQNTPSTSSLISLDVSINTQLTSLNTSYCVSMSALVCHQNYALGNNLVLSGSALTFLFCSDSSITNLILSGSPNLTTVWAQHNQVTTSSINQLYIDLDTFGLSNGDIRLSGSLMAPPTGAGITARTNLVGKGWTIDDASGIYP